MERRGSILAPAALALAALIGCGAPPTASKQQKLSAPVGDVSGCDQFGFAGTQALTDWSTDCGIPGSNIVNADGVPTGQVLELRAFFNCRTYDQDTWDEVMEWDQCLNGHPHPSGGDPTVSYDRPGCHYVDGVCGFAQLPDDPAYVDGSTPDGILLRVLISHLNDARAQIKAQGGANIDQQMQLLDAAQLFAELSNEAFVNHARALGVQSVSVGERIVDLAVNFVPGVALARDSVIVLSGKNPITGEQVSDTERAMIAGARLVPGFLEGAAHVLVDLGEAAEGVARSARADAAVAEDLVGAISRSDEEVTDLVHALPYPPLGELTSELAGEAESVLSSLREGDVGFGQAVRKDYATTFFDSYGWELKSEVGQVHHAVPQSVLTDYPGLISDAEMHSLENLRGIPIGPDGTALHQGDIAAMWNSFFSSYEEAGRWPTREELLSMARQVDEMFGSQFIPPIR